MARSPEGRCGRLHHGGNFVGDWFRDNWQREDTEEYLLDYDGARLFWGAGSTKLSSEDLAEACVASLIKLGARKLATRNRR